MNTVQYDQYKVSDAETRLEQINKAIEINEAMIHRSHSLDSNLMDLRKEREYLVNKLREEQTPLSIFY